MGVRNNGSRARQFFFKACPSVKDYIGPCQFLEAPFRGNHELEPDLLQNEVEMTGLGTEYYHRWFLFVLIIWT